VQNSPRQRVLAALAQLADLLDRAHKQLPSIDEAHLHVWLGNVEEEARPAVKAFRIARLEAGLATQPFERELYLKPRPYARYYSADGTEVPGEVYYKEHYKGSVVPWYKQDLPRLRLERLIEDRVGKVGKLLAKLRDYETEAMTLLLNDKKHRIRTVEQLAEAMRPPVDKRTLYRRAPHALKFHAARRRVRPRLPAR